MASISKNTQIEFKEKNLVLLTGATGYVDGIPETSADGQSQTDNINLEIIQKVEVFRGNNSSLFG